MRARTIVTTFVLLGLTLPALAEQKPSRDQEQIRRLRMQTQQLQQERDQAVSKAAQEHAESEKSLASRNEELAGLRNKAGASAKRTAALEAELETVKQERDRLAKALAALTDKAKATEAELAKRDGEATSCSVLLTKAQSESAACVEKNLALYQYGREVLEQYRGKGVWSALTQDEPVTGITRVRIENVLEEYRDKLDAMRINTPQAAAQ